LQNRRTVLAGILLAATFSVGLFPFDAYAANIDVEGEVRIEQGKIPEHAKVMATPVLGGVPFYATIQKKRFTFSGLPEGMYRFEIVLANNTVFAEAGAQELRIGPDANTVIMLVQHGRTDLPARPFWDWSTRAKVMSVAGGAALLAIGCAAADCFDDDESVSPSSP